MENDNLINVKTLKNRLENEMVPKSYYKIGGYMEEALCIIKENEKWVVFEGERGIRFNEHCFEKESDACIFFMQRIKELL